MGDKISRIPANVLKRMRDYPRGKHDPTHVRRLEDVLRGGGTIDPPVVDEDTMEVVIGWHRTLAHRRMYGEHEPMDVILRKYPRGKKGSALKCEDAMKSDQHGLLYSSYVRTRCVHLAEKYGFTAKLPGILGASGDRLAEMAAKRTAIYKNKPTPIKRSIEHLSGTTLSDAQARANEKLTGQTATLHINQLILLLDTPDLLLVNESQLQRLRTLQMKLDAFLE